jgi:hypothetical protein
MKTQFVTVLAAGLLLGVSTVRADDQADAKALLDKAMKAMNGEAKLAKLGTVAIKGKFAGKSGNDEFSVNFDATFKGANQTRAELEIQEGGRNTKGMVVLNGDKGWLKRQEKTVELPEPIAAFVHNLVHAGRMPLMLPALSGKAYTPTILAEGKVGDRPALGLLLSHKERKDVSLFFDKENGLLLKCEMRVTDPQGKEVGVEYLFSDYKDYDGAKLCGKIAMKLDDKELTMELIEIKPVEKVDASQFEKP